MNKEITVTNRMPQPPAINATLTGAAKRSADAATEAARQYFAALEQAERRLLNALNQEQNATNVADAQRALAAVPEPLDSLSPYWRSTATNEVSRVRHAIKEFAILSSGIPGVVANVPGDAAAACISSSPKLASPCLAGTSKPLSIGMTRQPVDAD